jgi:alcohol dehydrogenase class IV
MPVKPKRFRNPHDIVFGWDTLPYLEEKMEEYGSKRVFIVTDKVMREVGHVDRVLDIINKSGVETDVYDDISPNPYVEEARAAGKKMGEFGADLVVALGGGSPIDAAKAAWILYEHPNITDDDFINRDWDCIPPLREKARFIAIPTTSGTGSEVTCASVLTFPGNLKKGIHSFYVIPDVAIVDPALAATMPPSLTAASGMDVLVHAVEAFTSRNAHDLSDAVSKSATELTLNFLEKAYHDGSNKQGREKMHYASLLAGLAFNNAGLGAVHGCAHQLGGMFGVPHGLANAIMLPYVMKYNSNEPDTLKKYALLARQLGLTMSTDDRQAYDDLQIQFQVLADTVDIPRTLADYGIEKSVFDDALPALTQQVLNDTTTRANLRPVEADGAGKLLQASFDGDDSTL